jgi:subtilisin family serine protease
MSFGRDGPANCGASPDQAGCVPAIKAAIRYAVGKGVFIVIAAGNSFEDGNPTQVIPEIASRVQGAVSVAAVGVDAPSPPPAPPSGRPASEDPAHQKSPRRQTGSRLRHRVQ